MLGGAGPPREVLPSGMAHIGDAIPVTYAEDLLRGPWLGREWSLTAAAVMLGLLLASAILTMWRLRSEESM